MTEVATGRRRYRWLLLLLVAAILVAWLLTGGGQQDDPDPGATSSSPSSESTSSPTSSPTHELTVTTTPTTDPGGGVGTDPESGLPVVRLADLPPEAVRTLDLIAAGGPFPEPDHDGGTFGNREDLLPDQPRGYYREYTVPTPGVEARGARRIVAGDGGERYYTGDHYRSFSRIESDS